MPCYSPKYNASSGKNEANSNCHINRLLVGRLKIRLRKIVRWRFKRHIIETVILKSEESITITN